VAAALRVPTTSGRPDLDDLLSPEQQQIIKIHRIRRADRHRQRHPIRALTLQRRRAVQKTPTQQQVIKI
jgi:hypothetical protein